MTLIIPSLCENCLMAQDGTGSLPARGEMEAKYTWNLEDIYKTAELWEKDFSWVEENAQAYKNFQGKLGNSAEELFEAMKFDDEMGMKLSRLYLYSSLSKDLDLANSENRARYDRISALSAKVAALSSFMRPEILSLPEEKIKSFFGQSEGLRLYRHQFDNLFRTKEHTLSKEQEELLAMGSEVSGIPYSTFNVFTDAEMQFPVVKDTEGREVQISHGRYSAALFSTDREYRKRVYLGFYKPFREYKTTLSTLFSGNVKTHVFYSRARRYNSSKEAALDANNIPVTVYDNLIKSINENLEPLHRWARIKKRALGLDELHIYDSYVTLFPGVKKEYDFETGKSVVLEALKPMGGDYIKNLRNAFDNRWIDVYETKGKRSGAYSSGTTFGVHPYVLLNWNNQLNDVFTLAHEMGHNMHSFYTERTQPYPYADYSIFVAEVASTANEALLLDYLIDHAQSKEEKLALIEKYLTNITSTFYRQACFAEFEGMVHNKVEKGEPLTPDKLCSMYHELTQRYWGPDVVIDEEEDYTWARIPHFYYNFYVYQYATGLAASQALVAKIKKEGQPAIDRYLEFLKSGSSDYPINVLKKAGVDMTSKEPVLQTMSKMNELLDEMEKLLDQK
ncbi:MAG: oligoendopeptidase F [Ignavibacteria bacterium]|nr:oligoendopeptidase F [Ignavibacteria bacterium]MCU7502335.1 oligoendopeptidase F [Ignavibacteria bacterium]MCU7515100.1 oligoendopeptidase F [Ignavibacteria bacterium]